MREGRIPSLFFMISHPISLYRIKMDFLDKILMDLYFISEGVGALSIRELLSYVPNWTVFMQAFITLLVPLIILYVYKWLNKLEEV